MDIERAKRNYKKMNRIRYDSVSIQDGEQCSLLQECRNINFWYVADFPRNATSHNDFEMFVVRDEYNNVYAYDFSTTAVWYNGELVRQAYHEEDDALTELCEIYNIEQSDNIVPGACKKVLKWFKEIVKNEMAPN